MKKIILITLAIVSVLACISVAINHNRTEINKLKQPQTRECIDYTLREYRAGNAPQKCATEIYGDQF
jgi:hypothetical protein